MFAVSCNEDEEQLIFAWLLERFKPAYALLFFVPWLLSLMGVVIERMYPHPGHEIGVNAPYLLVKIGILVVYSLVLQIVWYRQAQALKCLIDCYGSEQAREWLFQRGRNRKNVRPIARAIARRVSLLGIFASPRFFVLPIAALFLAVLGAALMAQGNARVLTQVLIEPIGYYIYTLVPLYMALRYVACQRMFEHAPVDAMEQALETRPEKKE